MNDYYPVALKRARLAKLESLGAGAYTRPLSAQTEPFLTPKTSPKTLNTLSTPAVNTL